MNLIDCYGFSVDSQTMRVYLKEGKYVGMTEGIPTGANHITVGADHGDIIQKLKKVVINSDSNLVYLDIAGKPYAGEVKIWEELPHDEQGRLLVDSIGKIVRTFKGLGFTEFGGVAMNPKSELPAITSETGRSWESRDSNDGYVYMYWNSAGAFNYKVNKPVNVDLYMVGGGGGGRGQIIPMAQGGNGGGGSITQKTDLFCQEGSYTGNVGAGAQGGSSANAEWSTFQNESALGGGTSQTKADGQPSTEKTEVPADFVKCAAFQWNVPLSTYVSGSMDWDKTKQPNGVVYGQGGGGTNGTNGDSRAGNGYSGIVCIRWKK